MLIDLRVKIAFFILLILTSNQVLSNDKPHRPIISDSNEEWILFFSYHCSGCSDISNAVNLWALSDNVDLKKVPVTSLGWEPGARLYFLIELTKDIHYLNQYQRFSSGFSILNMTEDMPVDDVGFASLMRKFGMKITPLKFKERWRLSEIMLESSQDIMSDVPELTNVPAIRYFDGEKVSWITPEKNESSFELISRLKKIRDHNE